MSVRIHIKSTQEVTTSRSHITQHAHNIPQHDRAGPEGGVGQMEAPPGATLQSKYSSSRHGNIRELATLVEEGLYHNTV